MRRISELDALRGLASVVILIYHLRLIKVLPILGSAVDLFFVLSGYLITGILMRELGKPGALKGFYIRRALRIWPIYYLALGVALLLNRLAVHPHPTDALPYFAAYIPFIQAYWGGEMPTFPPMFVHVWSLAVEEQFYTFWPLVVMILGRRLRWVILPLMGLGVDLRARGVPPGLLLTHSDGLLLGAWLGLRENEGKSLGSPRILSACVVAACLFPLVRGLLPGWVPPGLLNALDPVRINLGYFGLIGLVLQNAGSERLRWLRHPRLVELGQISYGLYLYHPLVFAGVTTLYMRLGLKGTIWQESVWLDVVRVGLSFALARWSWRWVESPLLKLKDRLAPRGSESIWKGPHRVGSAEAKELESSPSHLI